MDGVTNAENPPAGYGRGYSADVDTIREQEYPLMNGIYPPLEAIHIQTDHESLGDRDNISRPCGDNTICQIHDRGFLAAHDFESIRKSSLHVSVVATFHATNRRY